MSRTSYGERDAWSQVGILFVRPTACLVVSNLDSSKLADMVDETAPYGSSGEELVVVVRLDLGSPCSPQLFMQAVVYVATRCKSESVQ